ncbi:M56 family metallopeptidase [Phytoactinopolyspora endophytica]|uniref:M56 family metallopeptidase n=1 Tax=Phytoactinopolyspora endophytica TaxID=1642495 RepID=UPI00101BE376|nr:M56 family metallopeptidase [Phytoactinopolyspora endophytica]
MSVALILWCYAAVLATVGATTLRRAGWTDRAPRLAIAAWQALSLSIVLATVFGSLALAVPIPQVSANLAELVESCAMAVQARYATPGGATLATGGLVLAALIAVRGVYCSMLEFSHSAAVRRRHRETLALVGRAAEDTGVTLLDDDRPYVYCVAGRRHRIVMTTGAHTRLERAQLDAVLAHERAHLRERHHLALAAAAALVRAFGWLWAFRVARDEVTRLVELSADDAASRTEHRLSLAEAMLTLSAGAPPSGTLAATGSTTATRIRRLITGHRPLAAWTGALGMTSALALVVAPLIALATPAMTAGPDCCGNEPARFAAADECAAVNRDCW